MTIGSAVAVCNCSCHADDEHDSGVELLDDVARVTACSRCANDHWRAFYESTQPKPPEKTPWSEPPPQADGWPSE